MLAEIVDNPLPKERARTDIHRHPLYYAVRNHIIDFLVSALEDVSPPRCAAGYDPRNVAGGAAGRHRARSCAGHVRRARRHRARTESFEHRNAEGDNMKREELTEKLLDIKREKGWTWKHICDADRRHVAGADRRRAARPA